MVRSILPGREQRIHVDTTLPRSEFEKQLKIVSMGDAYAGASVTSKDGMGGNGEFRPLGGD